MALCVTWVEKYQLRLKYRVASSKNYAAKNLQNIGAGLESIELD